MQEREASHLRVRRIDIAFILALLLLTIMLVVSYHIKDKLVDSTRWTTHTYEVLRSLDELESSLLEAESCRRAYIITARKELKQQYLLNAAKVPETLERVTTLTHDNKSQQQRLERLRDLIGRKLSNLSISMTAMDKDGYRKDLQSQMTEEGSMLMSMVRSGIDEIKSQEEGLLRERHGTEQITMSFLIIVIWGGILAAMTILCVAYYVARREAKNHQTAAGALEAANKDITNLSEMTQFLQSCASMGEVQEILSRYGARFFKGDFGGIYLLNPSRNLLVEAATWGTFKSDIFAPDQCWALRRGQAHLVLNDSDVKCEHDDNDADAHICIPLAAHHETLGVLHLGLTAHGAADAIEKKHHMAIAFAEQVALALRNLQLREQLRELSIRDPLTGLLNRRYMEESLAREISRAVRNKLPLSMIMMDVDHFKKFNDSFGHEAGDHVLKEFGYLLQKQVRGSDIACRFGGEEFTVILPEATRESALQKADALREAVKQLDLISGKQSLGKITISAGVAVFPEDGDTSQHLLAAADAALYRAKEKGRDRVESSVPVQTK